MKFLVYKVTFPNNKIYIGITSKSLETRKRAHFSMKTIRKYKFYNALNKYENLETWEIIDKTNSWNKVCKLERYYINKYNSCKYGYNSTSGGEGNYRPCKKVRDKMSSSQRGRKFSPLHRKKLSQAKLGKKYGPRSEKARINLALGQGAKFFKVFKKDTKEFVGEWLSQSKCGRDLKIYHQHISKCLRKKKGFLSVKGYLFTYSKEI